MRKAKVLFKKHNAGVLIENEQGYEFTYYPEYLLSKGEPIGFHFPLQYESFKNQTLFPLFSNLTSEGWLRDIQTHQQKLNDEFTLLINYGNDLIGAISLIEIKNGEI
ncbi:MAG: HipA N-terminal domain-containing protein [Pseudomonadales bacterium]|nr:HipA N-terminal domain-containing protein [Pseudomonadales bacterium]